MDGRTRRRSRCRDRTRRTGRLVRRTPVGQVGLATRVSQSVHTATVVVTGRDAAGRPVMWRVGRRRLAWRPRSVTRFLGGVDEWFLLAVLPLTCWYLLNWTAALAATPIVWAWRATTGRWSVVAYVFDADDDDRFRRVTVHGRAAAADLARQWATDIREHGQPACATGGSVTPSVDRDLPANT